MEPNGGRRIDGTVHTEAAVATVLLSSLLMAMAFPLSTFGNGFLALGVWVAGGCMLNGVARLIVVAVFKKWG